MFGRINNPDAAGIVKTFPAYDIKDTIAVYTINSVDEAVKYKHLLPNDTQSVLVGDGLTYRQIRF